MISARFPSGLIKLYCHLPSRPIFGTLVRTIVLARLFSNSHCVNISDREAIVGVANDHPGPPIISLTPLVGPFYDSPVLRTGHQLGLTCGRPCQVAGSVVPD